MARPKGIRPQYRLHKPTGQAVVTITSHDHYLGEYNTPVSAAESRRLVADLIARGCISTGTRRTADDEPPARAGGVTIAEQLAALLTYAKTYCRTPEGRPGNEIRMLKRAFKPQRELYGRTPAVTFETPRPGPSNSDPAACSGARPPRHTRS